VYLNNFKEELKKANPTLATDETITINQAFSDVNAETKKGFLAKFCEQQKDAMNV